MDLTPEEIRVLGCLVEKSHTTPDHYPLSTNALVAACNQKSSRDPVVTYSAREVDKVSTDLRGMGLVRVMRGTGMRTHKHKHILEEALGLSVQEQAVLAVLMLRGPQSHGELRTRTDRYVEFTDIDEVLQVLFALQTRPERFVINIGRESGQTQDRWQHTLSLGESSSPTTTSEPPSQQHDPRPQVPVASIVSNGAAARERTPPTSTSNEDSELERRVTELERRLAAIESSLGIDE